MRFISLLALGMAPLTVYAQLSPTPPETRPNTVMSMPVEALEASPLPAIGETLPSLVSSSVPGAPPHVMMPQAPKNSQPESQPAAVNPALTPPETPQSTTANALSAIFGDLVLQPQAPQPAPTTQPAAPETAPAKQMEMPEFAGIALWLNSEPLTKEALKGKVVLVDFWTYSCVNCVRTLPYLKEWYKKYKDRGFVIIGVHSPEFDFEKDPSNVKAAIQKLGIPYPVALDNQMATWAAYQNNVWPAHYFIDATGKVRHIHLGEGEYDKSEQMIQKLLTEAMELAKNAASRSAAQGGQPESQPTTMPTAETRPESQPETKPGPRGKKGKRAAAPETQPKPETRPAEKAPPPLPELSKMTPNVDFSQIKSPETYLGLLRRERLVTSGRPIEMNEWMFDGKWRTEGDRIVLAEGTGKILFRFNATKVNLVMTPTAGGVQAVVKIDGVVVPQPQAGADVKNGTVMITEPRMYELINLGTQGSEHIIEIEFLNPGAAAYAFTFG